MFSKGRIALLVVAGVITVTVGAVAAVSRAQSAPTQSPRAGSLETGPDPNQQMFPVAGPDGQPVRDQNGTVKMAHVHRAPSSGPPADLAHQPGVQSTQYGSNGEEIDVVTPHRPVAGGEVGP